MKQKDIALIIVIVILSAIVSLFVSKALFASPKNRHQNVEVVNPISTKFPEPDKSYFNDQSFDPAQPIDLGQNANSDPFGGGSSD
jgi:hypothetical protein